MDAASEHVYAGDQGMDVADDLVRGPAVAAQDAPHVGDGLAGAEQPYRRQEHALLEGVGGHRGQTAGGHAAEIGHVDERPRKEERASLDDDRLEDQEIVGVDAASVGVVHDIDVTRDHVGQGDVEQQLGQRAAQARRVHEAGRGRLRDEAALGVQKRPARVGPLLDEERLRRANDHDAGLFGGDGQGRSDHLGGHRVLGPLVAGGRAHPGSSPTVVVANRPVTESVTKNKARRSSPVAILH